MRGLIPAAALGVVLLITPASPAGQTSVGSIAGHVKLKPRVGGTPLPSPLYPSRSVGRQAPPSTPEIKNVVVYVKGVPFRGALPVMRGELRQEGETFVPHVVAITRGSTVDFPNADPIFHNVFSLSGAAAFSLGRYPQGQSHSQPFMKAGLVKVFCNIHSHMSAAILVLDHPYFVIPELDGTFDLRGIPPGEYTLVGWHERIGERTTPVRVEAGKATTANLSLPIEEAP